MLNDEYRPVKTDEEKGRELYARTKDFAIRVIRRYAELPNTAEALVIGKQLLRSATSVGAHYREACRARSRAEFVSKLEVGLQELEESIYWLELLSEGDIVPAAQLVDIRSEADELMAILVASAKTAKNRTL